MINAHAIEHACEGSSKMLARRLATICECVPDDEVQRELRAIKEQIETGENAAIHAQWERAFTVLNDHDGEPWVHGAALILADQPGSFDP